MGSQRQEQVERAIKAAKDRGEYKLAVELGIRAYGPQILGTLARIMRNREDAEEVYQTFGEDVTKGIASFRGDSFFSWAYAVANNARLRFHSSAHTRVTRASTPISQVNEEDLRGASSRTPTADWKKTDTRNRIIALAQERLSEDDHLLLVLRAKGLSWAEIATVMLEKNGEEERSLTKESNRLKRRFVDAKRKIHEFARREGIIADEDG